MATLRVNRPAHFPKSCGGGAKATNDLPIVDGWNDIVPCYLPGWQIIEGNWTPPAPQPVD